MTPQEFSARFCLFNLFNESNKNSSNALALNPSIKKRNHSKTAAVLVPIMEGNNGLEVLFTKRAAHLRHHPGQISFPGGKYETFDDSLTHTALRESEEEIGLNPNNVSPLGWLPSQHTASNFSIYPLVAMVKKPQNYLINRNEVDNVFTVPFAHFFYRQSHVAIQSSYQGKAHKVHFMPYQNHLIWGATAAIIDQLILHVGNER